MQKYFIILLGCILMQSCIKKEDVVPPAPDRSRSLAVTIQNNYTFSMFAAALQRTGYDKLIAGDSLYTLLVPNDAAFAIAGVTPDSLQHMDISLLRKIVSYHIFRGIVKSSDIPQTIDYPLKSLSGQDVFFSVPIPGPYQNQYPDEKHPYLHINGSTVIRPDIVASNGMIQSIDRLLEYPAANIKEYLETHSQYSLYTQGLRQFGLLDRLAQPGPFVVIAPTNDAFLMHGYDSVAIAAMDTSHYKKSAFGGEILRIGIFFHTDMNDGPMAPPYNQSNNPPVYVAQDFLVILNYGSFGLSVFDFLHVINTYEPPYWNNPYQYGDQVSLDYPDHLTLNGVVHGTTGLMAIPDSLIIK